MTSRGPHGPLDLPASITLLQVVETTAELNLYKFISFIHQRNKGSFFILAPFPRLCINLLLVKLAISFTLLLILKRFNSMTTKTSISGSKLDSLRKLMQERGIHAYYVPSEDAHQNEYIAPWDARRAFISGFTGSAGYAMVTLKQASLWTDGRYFLQAEKQLDKEHWTLMKDGLPDTPKKHEWLIKILEAGSKVGVDPLLISFEESKKFGDLLKEKDIILEPIDENLIDSVWGSDRPARVYHPIMQLGLEYSGQSAEAKIQSLVDNHLKKNDYKAIIVSELDEIAWLFNLRGSDISFNPIFFAYAIITSEGDCTLYLANEENTSVLLDKLGKELKNVPKILPYNQIFKHLKDTVKGEKKILVSKNCNLALIKALGGPEAVAIKPSPIAADKAIKNETELKGFRECHKRDGAAIVKYFAWLEDQLDKNQELDEVDGANQLERFRQLGKNYVGLSFDTISSTGPNGAVIHYKPEKPSALKIKKDQVYLCDSGAQYLDGTTDTTRTVHFGTPTPFEKEAFTRVLKGVINLDSAIFPKSTAGIQLDTLARKDLWKVGLDYRHGTGHGVGSFLNVHEGPHSISFRRGSSDEPLKAGMTVTDEPGYYHDGSFGIRIENILIVRQANPKYRFGGEDNWLQFENVTMVPIDSNLIDKSLLDKDEITWINEYHAKVKDLILPFLSDDSLATKYLLKATQAI
jgi:Xaa-Pro aminopeptidase